MKINRQEFLRALEIVKPGIASKEHIKQTTSFVFTDSRVHTYNQEVSISCPIEALNITGAVDAFKLFELIERIKTDEIEVDCTATELLITAKRVKAGITLQTEITLPVYHKAIAESEWKTLPEAFSDLLLLAITTCGKLLDTKESCVSFDKKGFLKATDGIRHLKCDIGTELLTDSVLIPAFSAKQIQRIKPTHIARKSNWLFVKNENTEAILACLLLMEDYVPYIDAMVKPIEGTKIKLPTILPASLDSARIFTKEDDSINEKVDISIHNKALTIQSKDESGWFEETLNVNYEGPDLHFVATPFFLKEVLTAPLAVLNCTLRNDRQVLQFEGSNWVCTIRLV